MLSKDLCLAGVIGSVLALGGCVMEPADETIGSTSEELSNLSNMNLSGVDEIGDPLIDIFQNSPPGGDYALVGSASQHDSWRGWTDADDGPNRFTTAQCDGEGTDVLLGGWYLKEINARDFARSRVNCKRLDGATVGPLVAQLTHFEHDRNGTNEGTYAPDGLYPTTYTSNDDQIWRWELPVGIRLWTDGGSLRKVYGAQLLTETAASIVAGTNDFAPGYGTAGRSRGSDVELFCNDGAVVTGIGLYEIEYSFPDQSEIVGVTLRCQTLERQ